MISLKPWCLFLYITRAMTSLLFANAGPVTFKAPASLQPNIALLPAHAQGYQMSNVEIFTKNWIFSNPIQFHKKQNIWGRSLTLKSWNLPPPHNPYTKKEIGPPRNLHAKDSNAFPFSCIGNEKLPSFSCTATGSYFRINLFWLLAESALTHVRCQSGNLHLNEIDSIYFRSRQQPAFKFVPPGLTDKDKYK